MRTIVAIAVLGLAGCNREDGEKLVRVGRVVTEKVRAAAPARTPFGDLAPDATPAGKVRARIRTDSYLADLDIQVVEAEDGLHLRGTVPSKEHSDRAGQLARDTVDVNAVINELSVGP
ncbi:MAG TPA: BON domain-containing protein [Gemmataceae bacterium]|jgi:osmotically-inducible protein OsmY|nr:BON domain-containing protein [Gemmataceae bacterium]